MKAKIVKEEILRIMAELDAFASAPTEGPLPLSVKAAQGGIAALELLGYRLGFFKKDTKVSLPSDFQDDDLPY